MELYQRNIVIDPNIWTAVPKLGGCPSLETHPVHCSVGDKKQKSHRPLPVSSCIQKAKIFTDLTFSNKQVYRKITFANYQCIFPSVLLKYKNIKKLESLLIVVRRRICYISFKCYINCSLIYKRQRFFFRRTSCILKVWQKRTAGSLRCPTFLSPRAETPALIKTWISWF